MEPFEVPKELSEKGYTGRVIVNKLVDQVRYIESKGGSLMAARQFGAEWLVGSADFELPATGVSMQALLEFIREIFGRQPTRIIGEVVLLEKDSIQVTIRIVDNLQETNVGKLKDLESLLFQSAKYLYKKTQPYRLATFLYRSSDDSSSCVEMIQYCLANDPVDDDVWAYSLWGLVLWDLDKYSEAIEKFKLAIEVDPKFAIAYFNWGLVLGDDLYKYSEAIEKFKKATELEPKNPDTYYSWGRMLEAMKNEQEAIAKFERVVELAPQSSFAKPARNRINRLKERVAAK